MGSYSKNFFRCMKECKDAIFKSKNSDAGKIWLEVKKFVETGKYTSYKRADELVKLILGGYTDKYIANSLGIGETTVRIHKRNLSNDLYGLFGIDFFDLLADYDNNRELVGSRMISVRNVDVKSTDLFPEDLLALVNSTSVTDISELDIDSCRAEVSYLLKHSLTSLKTDFKKVNVDKLNYLLGIINCTKGTPKDRYYLLSLLLKEDGTRAIS